MRVTRLLLFAIICLSCFVSKRAVAQYKKSDCPGFKDSILRKFIYKEVDKAPEVKGGYPVLRKRLANNLVYPTGNIEYKGKVIVAFVVEPNGKINGKRTVYDPSGRYRLFCDQILYIVDDVKWVPGLCNGKAVPCLYTLTVPVSAAL